MTGPKKPPVAKATGVVPKKLTLAEKMKTFDGDILQGKYDYDFLKRVGIYEKTCLRKMRYWCFKIRHAQIEGKPVPPYPKGFKKFIESLPGFAGWEYFAVTWDIFGKNPYMIILRLQSVWQEWDQVMERVAIPINTPPQQLHDRLQALQDDYAKKNK